MRNLITADIPLSPVGGFKGFGNIGLVGKDASESPILFNNFLSTTIGVMTIIAIIWFVIQFFIAAIGIIFSGGDKGKLAEARTKLTTSIIGLVVVVAAIFLIEIVGNVLGITNILNPAVFIYQQTP